MKTLKYETVVADWDYFIKYIEKDEKLLFITSKTFEDNGFIELLKSKLKENAICVLSGVKSHPEIEDLQTMINKLEDEKINTIISVGGGSVIDSGKILSLMLSSQNKNLLHFLENPNSIDQISRNIKLISIPTTSGTGAEATNFATIWNSGKGLKYSLESKVMHSDLIILDVNLTLSLPYSITLSSALDTYSHALDSIWNRNRSFLSDLYVFESLDLLNRNLETTLKKPLCVESRAALQKASYLAGLSIQLNKTSIAHSISYPITSLFGVPHGFACSFTLPKLIDLNINFIDLNSRQRDLVNHAKVVVKSFEISKYILMETPIDSILNIPDELFFDSKRFSNYAGNTNYDIKDLIKTSLGTNES